MAHDVDDVMGHSHMQGASTMDKDEARRAQTDEALARLALLRAQRRKSGARRAKARKLGLPVAPIDLAEHQRKLKPWRSR